MRILGAMTGTSCDGLDAACVEFTANGRSPQWKILWSAQAGYPKALREKILRLQLPGRKITLREFLATDRDLGEWYGKTFQKFIENHADKPEFIANHGQTVAHHPDLGCTLQMGDPTRIAHATDLTVISHFREGDLSAGGQGAPLLPLFHRILANRLPGLSKGLSVHNLGGISNLTYIDPRNPDRTLAFDTGPSNIWIDEAVSIATRRKRKFDADGSLARKGKVDEAAVRKILATGYFKKQPPKSTGRDDFPFSMLKSKTRARGADLVATATAITAESIARAYEDVILKNGAPLEVIYFAGGGAKNSHLLDLVSRRLEGIRIRTLADAGVPGLSEQVLEALGFAMFGYLSLQGASLGGTWTGANGFGSPGWITPGKNWSAIFPGSSDLFR